MKRALKTFTMSLIIMFTMMLASCHCNESVENVTVKYGKFEQRVDIDDVDFIEIDDGNPETPVGYMAINTAIAQGSDQVQAVLHLMEVAEHNYYTAINCARISLGGGSALAAGLTGKMEVRSLYVREGDVSYSQTIGRVYEGDPQSLLGAAQLILDQGKRTYTINRNKANQIIYRQEPKNKGNPTMKTSFPYAECDFNKAKEIKIIDANSVDEDDFSLKYKGELTNFKINASTLKADSCSIVYNEDDELYTVVYEIDITNEDAVERPRASLRKSSSSSNLEYLKYKVTMELWDNGLIKTYSTEEEWAGTLKLGLSFEGASESKNTDYYSWDDDDCEIEEYVEDGIIDLDWVPNN